MGIFRLQSGRRARDAAAAAVLGALALGAASARAEAPPPAEAPPHLAQAFQHLPLSFEPNVGQAGGNAGFLAHGAGYALFLAPDEAVLRLRQRPAAQAGRLAHLTGAERLHRHQHRPASAATVLRMKLVGAAAQPDQTGLDALPGRVNYLHGRDPANWHTDLPTYAKVAMHQVYPGIDLVYYGSGRQLEYDFVVAPGANPDAIRMAVSRDGDATPPRVAENGDLLVGDGVRIRKAVVYQTDPAAPEARIPVDGDFTVAGNEVGFTLGAYDHSRPLVIDPVLAFSTYFSIALDDEGGSAMAVDAQGSAYITGDSDNYAMPVLNAFQPEHATGDDSDAFVTKLNPEGTALVYSTYLGGTGEDAAFAIKVDATGSAYVTGYTCSFDFPVTPGAFQTVNATPGCTADTYGTVLFITKLAPSGSSLAYSTLYGGTNSQEPWGLAVDALGNAYVDGVTNSVDLPVTPGVVGPSYQGAGVNALGDAFVAKLNPTGTALVYSTYLGGSGDDFAWAIAVDTAGDAYVGGQTSSTDFPITANAFQKTLAGSGPFAQGDGFVTKLNPTATAFLYSTYLGGSSDDAVYGIAVDGTGAAYVTGGTTSADFPVTPRAYQVVYGGAGTNAEGDVFVSKLNPAGSRLVFSSYVGGEADESPYAIALDSHGDIWVTGVTDSTDFPTTPGALQREYGGAGANAEGDGFLFALSRTGSKLVYSTFIGGSGDDIGTSVAFAVDAIFVGGYTTSPNFPVTAGAYDTTCGADGLCDGGANAAFVMKFEP